MLRHAFLVFLLLFSMVCHGQYLQVIDFPAFDIAFSENTNRLYVTKYQSDTDNLCVLNPQTGEVDTCYSFPGTPFSLAVSEDQVNLFVGFGIPGNPGRIIQIALPSGQVVMNAAIPANSIPRKIWPVPGTPNSIVARISYYQPTSIPDYIGVFDSGIQRPQTIITADEIAFTNSNNKLIGIYSSDWATPFILYDLTANGLVQTQTWQMDHYSPSLRLNHYGDYIVTSTGSKYDISTGVPIYKTFLFDETFKPGGPSAYDEAIGEVYFVLNHQADPYATTINNYLLSEFHYKSKFGHPDLRLEPTNMVSCGGDGKLAITTQLSDKLILVNPCTSSDMPPTITADTFGVCNGDTVVLFPTPGYMSYLWPGGDITPTFNATTSANYYTVQAVGADGCLTEASDPIHIFFDNPPVTPWYEPSGLTSTICEGDSIEISASVFNSTEYYTYSWSTGDTTAFITVDMPGEYWLSLVSEHGCVTSAVVPKIIETIPNPETPIISMLNDTTLSTNAFNVQYQWFRDGLPLLFGKGPNIVLDTPGIYSVVVTSFEGCVSGESAPYYFDNFPVYPNPATTEVNLWNNDFGQIGSYKIMNIAGEVVAAGEPDGNPISISALNNGLYFIFWFNSDGMEIGESSFIKNG